MPDASSPDRSSRLKAALRENLKRRKAQARGREATRGLGSERGAEPAAPTVRREE